jgi:hypothetical protein
MAFLVNFPLHVNYGDGTAIAIEDPTTLQTRFAEVFPERIASTLLDRKDGGPSCMHDKIMYASGAVWVDMVGQGKAARFRVVTVNLPGAKVAHTGPRVQYVCDAAKHRIAVDALGVGKPRYRAWNKPRPTTDAPDMEIKDGDERIEGTYPCTRSLWIFRRGRTEFQVVRGLGCFASETAPPKDATGELSVSVSEKTIQHWWCY